MGRRGSLLLGDLELAIMKAVWAAGDVSVDEVLQYFSGKRKPHHNTVMTVMNRLWQKGLLERYPRDGRSSGYRPKVSQGEVSRAYLDMVTTHFFRGSPREAAAALLGGETPSAKNRGEVVRKEGGR